MHSLSICRTYRLATTRQWLHGLITTFIVQASGLNYPWIDTKLQFTPSTIITLQLRTAFCAGVNTHLPSCWLDRGQFAFYNTGNLCTLYPAQYSTSFCSDRCISFSDPTFMTYMHGPTAEMVDSQTICICLGHLTPAWSLVLSRGGSRGGGGN